MSLNACKHCVLPITNSLRTEIPIVSKIPASGCFSMNISRIGNRATSQVSYGYRQIQDVASQSCRNHSSTKISNPLLLALCATSSLRTTVNHRRALLMHYVHYCIKFSTRSDD